METPPDSDDFDREEHERIMRTLRPYFSPPEATPEMRRRATLGLLTRLWRSGKRPLYLSHRRSYLIGTGGDEPTAEPARYALPSCLFSADEIALAQSPSQENGYAWHVEPDGTGWITRAYR